MLTFEELQKEIQSFAEEKNLDECEAFIYFVLEKIKDLSEEEALDCVIDGPYDGGVDVIYTNEEDKEIIILQSKFTKDLDKQTLESGIKDLVRGVKHIFGEKKQNAPNLDDKISKLNLLGLLHSPDTKLKAIFITSSKVGENKEERRKLERNYEKNLAKFLKEKGFSIESKFEILDIRTLSEMLGEISGISEVTFELNREFFEKNDKSAVVLTIKGDQIGELVEKYGEDIFENNVRRFLGFRGNINKAIKRTLENDDERSLFWYFNNGIVAICENYKIEDNHITLENFSIINGAQTANILKNAKEEMFTLKDVEVLMKVININKIPKEDKLDLIASITLAANSQNPTNTRDLRSVDKIQKYLERKFKDLGYQYIRRRGIRIKKTDKTIFMKDLAQAYTALFLEEPYMAYSRVNDIFGKNEYYERVFPKDILEMEKNEVSKFFSKYIVANKLLQLIRNKLKQDDSLPNSIIYHILWCFRRYLNEIETIEPNNAENFASDIFQNRNNIILQASRLAIANLKNYGFELPKDAKSREGFEKFREAFNTNINVIGEQNDRKSR
jgi:hypothetical protein